MIITTKFSLVCGYYSKFQTLPIPKSDYSFPKATHFKSHPALLAWELFTEVEGLLYVGESNREKCFDTIILKVFVIFFRLFLIFYPHQMI